MRERLSKSIVVQRLEAIVDASIDDEIVALNVHNGVCYGLNRIGSRIWELMRSPVRVGDLCAQLMSEYDVDPVVCEEQTLDLLEELRTEGLLIVKEAGLGNS